MTLGLATRPLALSDDISFEAVAGRVNRWRPREHNSDSMVSASSSPSGTNDADGSSISNCRRIRAGGGEGSKMQNAAPDFRPPMIAATNQELRSPQIATNWFLVTPRDDSR